MERLPDDRSATAPHGDVLAGGWLNQLPAAAAIMSADGRVLAWNMDAARLMGWRAASAAPRMGSAESPWLVRLLKDVNELGSGRVMIGRMRGAARMSLELRARRIAQGDLLILMRDCTAQLAARHLGSGQERRLRRFLDRLPEAALIDRNGRIIYANDAAARLLGVRRELLVGASLEQLLGGGAVARIERLHDDNADVGSGPIEVEVQRPAGGAVAVQVAALPLHYRRGPALQLLLRDVTAQRQAEAALRATHERLRLIAETVRDHAIVTIDGNGRVASWNASAERLTGFTADDMIRAPFARLYGGTRPDLDALLDTASTTGRSDADRAAVRGRHDVARAGDGDAAERFGRAARRLCGRDPRSQ
jgi:PAS domain S-box-containing protein